jgi:hypothetical protein
MYTVYKFFKIAVLLIVALAVLWAGFSVLSLIRGMCVSMIPPGVCQFANTCLSALLLFFVAYYTLMWINKLWRTPEGH